MKVSEEFPTIHVNSESPVRSPDRLLTSKEFEDFVDNELLENQEVTRETTPCDTPGDDLQFMLSPVPT